MSVNNILNRAYKVLFHNSINICRQCEIVCASNLHDMKLQDVKLQDRKLHDMKMTDQK